MRCESCLGGSRHSFRTRLSPYLVRFRTCSAIDPGSQIILNPLPRKSLLQLAFWTNSAIAVHRLISSLVR